LLKTIVHTEAGRKHNGKIPGTVLTTKKATCPKRSQRKVVHSTIKEDPDQKTREGGGVLGRFKKRKGGNPGQKVSGAYYFTNTTG